MEDLNLLTSMVSKGRNTLKQNNQIHQTDLNELEGGLQDIYDSLKLSERVLL
jgi:hypothetical protein